jgi:3-hydroxyisobutyrate dehydrogenase
MFDQLDAVRRHIAERLSEAASNRKSPMHTPVVGTADGEMRVMVMRDFDTGSWTLRFHTDARSPKVATIGEGAPVSVLLYDPGAKVQIRVKGIGRVESAGPVADKAWAEANNFARRCYLAEAAPGAPSDSPTSGLPPEVEGIEPDDATLITARENFAVLLVRLESADWLYLAHTGHRRAQFDLGSGEGRWVVP